MIEVTDIKTNSTADRIGLKPGDKILTINDKKIRDYIDYNYQVAEFNFKLKVKKKNGKIKEYDVQRRYDEKLGIEFDEIIFDSLNKCKNKCIFCFVDQQPPNLRDTLNLKDDDYRFSFLQGSYISLTNLSDQDFERIIKYNLSPLNISVHTTDPKLREYMMKNPKAGEIKKQLDFLSENNIKFNTQIVLCPNINDQEKLDESIKDLSKYYPNILSLAVVPVGLTKYKNENLRTYTKIKAKEIIKQIKNWQQILKKEFDENFLYASDEFYLMSGIDIPEYEHYGSFLQLENGVGLTRLFRNDYKKFKSRYLPKIRENKKNSVYHIITSVLGKKAIKPVIDDLNKNLERVRVEIHKVENKFFGKTVTVTGLLTARDIEDKIKDKRIDNIIIPKVVLNDDNLFLDGVTFKTFKNKYNELNIYLCDDIKDIMEVLINGETSGGDSR